MALIQAIKDWWRFKQAMRAIALAGYQVWHVDESDIYFTAGDRDCNVFLGERVGFQCHKRDAWGTAHFHAPGLIINWRDCIHRIATMPIGEDTNEG